MILWVEVRKQAERAGQGREPQDEVEVEVDVEEI